MTSTKTATYEEEDVCPICLGGDESEGQSSLLVYGNCGHKFCLPCLQQLFAAPSTSDSNSNHLIPSPDDLLNVPTLGRCPICRQILRLLDLKCCSDDNENHEDAVPREHDMSQTDLASLVFVKPRRKEGDQSIHFPSRGQGENSLPFVSFENGISNYQFDDGTKATIKKKIFDPSSCLFHKESRTFHGTIRWDVPDQSIEQHQTGQISTIDCGKRLGTSNAWEYILSFSSDFRYVARGVLIKRRDPCRRVDCPRMACKFPLDGEWTVNWGPDCSDEHKKEKECVILVHGNTVYLGSGSTARNNRSIMPSGAIEFESTSQCPILEWFDDSGFQQVGHIEEPGVGGSISWSRASNQHGSMVWCRKTVTPDDVPLHVVKLGSERGLSYHRLGVIADNSATKQPYHSDRLWGNVFCQVMTVGMASYHFNQDGSAYISYEHESTSVWPNLDDGQPIPPRMTFVDTNFDEGRRTFHGIIDWEGTYGTTWTSSRMWKYKIVFAHDYSFIIGGNVRVVRRGDEEEIIMSTFGEDLLYVNVGFAEQTKNEMESEANPVSALLDEANRLRDIRRQMEDLGASADYVNRLQSLFFWVQNSDVRYPATRLFSQQDYGL